MRKSPVPGYPFNDAPRAEFAIGVVYDADLVFYRQMDGVVGQRNRKLGRRPHLESALADLPILYPTKQRIMDFLRPRAEFRSHVIDGLDQLRYSNVFMPSGFTTVQGFEQGEGLRYLFDTNQWYFSQTPYVRHSPVANALDHAYCFDIILSETDDGRWHVTPDVLHAVEPPNGMPTWKKFRQFLMDNDVRTPMFPTDNVHDQIYVGEDIASYIRMAYPQTQIWT